jgi:flavin-dependent dehydrogenase
LNTIRRDGQHWHIAPERVPAFRARYLVDATGRARAIARRLGVRPRFYDQLIALTAVVKRNPNSDFDHAMLIESTADGWWYAAPVPQGHVLAFFTDADLAPPALKRRLRTVAANSAFTQSENSQTWLTVGDACAAHDPLCGWGVCRALTNGILAADAICGYLGSGDDALLESYHAHCRQQFDTYLAGLTKHYALEHRWAHSIFWERRLTPISFAN